MTNLKNISRLTLMALGGVLISSLPAMIAAQDAAPLIRRPSNVTVRKVDPNDSSDPGNSDSASPDGNLPVPQATPDPTTVIVAIVNHHSISRAQLDRRVQARTRYNPKQIREGYESTMKILDHFGEDVETNPVDEYQADQLAQAIRDEEASIIQDWQDQMMLADEARRHGFLVTNQELQMKLDGLEEEFHLNATRVDNLLDAMGMTRAELESFVYDALLIEKLLDRFIELNYSDADFFNTWEQNPALYRTPPKKRIAHFTEGLLGNERPTYLRKVKDNMQDIRDELRSGTDVQELINQNNNIEFGLVGSIVDWSTESNVQNRSNRTHNLPDAVVKELMKRGTGDVSSVITDEYSDSSGETYILSFHVFKVIEELPAEGETFEQALPLIRNDMTILAREIVLNMVRDAKTHKRITRLSGIAPDKLPDAEELRGFKPPVSLKLGT